MSLTIADSKKFEYRIRRIIEKKEPLSFLIGSGLTFPYKDQPGIPSAGSIVRQIQDIFATADGQPLFDEALAGKTDASAYQAAMKLLVECEGQTALNRVIQNSVLQAYTGKENIDEQSNLESVETNHDAWHLNAGVSALGSIYTNFPDLIGPILTSNFDPLIGISIRKAGGDIGVHPISEDGSLFAFETAGAKRRIVHFHGYWRGVDTLHTTDQITRSRPKLAGDLRKLLKDSNLVVIGYGGWEDVFMSTLAAVIEEGAVTCNILWGFYEEEDEVIRQKYPHLFRMFAPQLGSRVILYKGVDAHVSLSEIAKSVGIAEKKIKIPVYIKNSVSKSLAVTFANDPGCDALPNADFWTGRLSEMQALSSKNYRVAILTGIGGQGKSCLASVFLSNLKETEEIQFWDWRDCKEERNHMHTNLVSICLRLAKGSLKSDELKDESETSLVELLFTLIEEKNAIFVFDNVDEYIDLKTLKPTGAINTLIREALKRTHNVRFLLTCRPEVSLVETNLLHLPIKGFSHEECKELFKKYGASLN